MEPMTSASPMSQLSASSAHLRRHHLLSRWMDRWMDEGEPLTKIVAYQLNTEKKVLSPGQHPGGYFLMSHVFTDNSPNTREVIHEIQKQYSFGMESRAKNGKITTSDSQPPSLPFVREGQHRHGLPLQAVTRRPSPGPRAQAPYGTLLPPH